MENRCRKVGKADLVDFAQIAKSGVREPYPLVKALVGDSLMILQTTVCHEKIIDFGQIFFPAQESLALSGTREKTGISAKTEK